jgi:uncharacterized protein (UPF0335 family)
MSAPGHNSAATKDELLGYAQRIERLKDEKKNATLEYDDAIKEVWAEAKGRGFDKKALNEVLRMRAMSDEQRQLVEFYLDVAEVFQ